MKIYFAGAIRGGRENAGIYVQLIDFLEQFGEVLTCHIGKKDISTSERQFSEQEIHDRDFKWLSEADVIIAEVSTPSLGVGYEIGRAVEAGKPILCLYNIHADFELSALIAGCRELNVAEYERLTDTYPVIRKFIEGI
jgi:2'-deoxynucleoside 5'-phosphate N-hydrolase